MHLLLAVVILIITPWTWKLFSLHPTVGFLSCLSCLTLTLAIFTPPRLSKNRQALTFLFLLSFTLLLLVQKLTTTPQSLIPQDPETQRRQLERMNQYPPVALKIGHQTLWIPLAHWIEDRKESVFLSQLQSRLFDNLDINQYFFAGHPREKNIPGEFEKFPYIFFPFLLLGIISLASSSKTALLFLPLAISLTLLSFIGNRNSLGPFILLPTFIALITQGMILSYSRISNSSLPAKKILLFVSSLLFALIIIQSFRY